MHRPVLAQVCQTQTNNKTTSNKATMPAPAIFIGMTTPSTAWRRHITLLLCGQGISLLGTEIVQLAAYWYITLETKSGSMLALYALVGFAPRALVAFFAGALADRLNRKYLMMVSDGAIALCTLGLALWLLTGNDPLWAVLFVVFLRSIGGGFQLPALNAVIPQIVPKEHLMRINSINSTMAALIYLFAPAAAGVIYAVGGMFPTLLIDVITAALGIGLLFLIPVAKPPRKAAPEPILRELRSGVRYLIHHRTARWVILLSLVLFALAVAPSFMVPLQVTRRYGEQLWMLSILESGFSLGMTIGGALLAWRFSKVNRWGMLLFSSIVISLSNILLGIAPNFWFICAVFWLLGLIEPFSNVPTTTLLQETTDPEYHGRIFSFFSISFAVATPIGMLLSGPLSDALPIETVLIGAGVLALLFTVLVFTSPDGRAARKLQHSKPTQAATADN